MNVRAVVVAGVRRSGPDALTCLGGEPLVVWAVRSVLAADVVERVIVLVEHEADAARFATACAGLPVDVRASALRPALSLIGPHGRQRSIDTDGDAFVTSSSADVVLVHDAMRPLTPSALVTAVIDAVRQGCRFAVPVLPLADTVKQVDAGGVVRGTADRAALRVVQAPLALRADLVPDGDPLGFATQLAAAGVAVHTVSGDPRAFSVRTEWDLHQAQLLAGMISS